MPAISVIMPVYNSETFLPAAIDSVLHQTFTDLELVLVDDGSQDGSGAICDRYAEQDSRVVVVHQKNGGICAARNTGLDTASGEFIAFIDNDDEYYPTLLEKAYGPMVEHQADVVKYGYHVRESFPDGRENNRQSVAKELMVIHAEDKAPLFLEVRQSGFFYTIWNGLYRKSFLDENGFRFDEEVRFGFEDFLFNYHLYEQVRCAVVLNEVHYLHEQREGFSTSKKFKIDQPYNCAKASAAEKALFDHLHVAAYHPGLWERRLIEALGEILLLFHLSGCDLTKKEKIQCLQELSEREPFSEIQSKPPVELDFRKRLVWTLFAQKRYGALLMFSQGYGRYLQYRKTH